MAARTATPLAFLLFLVLSLSQAHSTGANLTIEQKADVPIDSYPASRTDGGGYQGRIAVAYHPETWRTGWYYLPPNYSKRIMPVLVMLHGSGMNGYDMLNVLRAPADRYKFAVIAPDSHQSLYWFDPKAGKPFTTDWEHVEACFQYVKNLPDVRFNPRKVAYGGFSRGGYAAGAMATRVGRATHAMVFHSLVHPNELGKKIVPFWFSSGLQDPLFSKSKVLRSLKAIEAAKPQLYGHVTTGFFKGGHHIDNQYELDSAIQWWFRN